MTSKIFNLLTLRFKYAPHLSLLSTGIFSKLYYNNNKELEQLTENILDYPADIKIEYATTNSSNILQTLNALTTVGYNSFNIKIPSSNFSDNNDHLFRKIKIFKNEYANIQFESSSDVFEQINNSERTYGSIDDIPKISDHIVEQDEKHQIISTQSQLLPEIIICHPPTEIQTNKIFYYGKSKIYSNNNVEKLTDVDEIKELFVDAGYSQFAEQIDFLNETLDSDTNMVGYTQKFNSDTVYMNVICSSDENMHLIFNVQIITDDKDTLVKKSVEKYDKRTLYGSMIIFSLCVIIRNLIPF